MAVTFNFYKKQKVIFTGSFTQKLALKKKQGYAYTYDKNGPTQKNGFW